MNSALIIIDKAPYGQENALSGIYIAITGLDKGIKADILLIGDGVYTALKNHSSEKTIQYTSVNELLYSTFPNGTLYVHLNSVIEKGIEYDDMVEIAELIDDKSLYNIAKTKQHIIKI